MKKILISALLGIVLVGCASQNQFRSADQLLERGDYTSALKEYLAVAEASGSLVTSKNVRALEGAMIAYFNIGEYAKSFSLSRQILTFDKYNSSAIFYAGMNLEKLNKLTLAKKIFRYYLVLSDYDPYKSLIKAKFNDLVQKEMKIRAKLAIQMENNISLDQIDSNTLAVLYFINIMEDPEWGSIGKGLAEMMITDLAQVKSLKVIERIELQKLLEELQLGMSGLVDEKTTPRMGKLLKAKIVVNGAFTVNAGQNLTINSEPVDVTEAKVFQVGEFSGILNDIFSIEKKIVFNILEELNITLSASEKKKIGKFATNNLQAFKAYCNGLDEYDFGNYDTANSYFQQAVDIDPNFLLAADMLSITSAMNVIERAHFVQFHFRPRQRGIGPGVHAHSMRARNSTQFRLQQLSRNMALIYLPGTESRNGSSEIITREDFWRGTDWQFPAEILPPPPDPPPGR
ncbi:MAG: CsgG/HfaB family protein [Candidatus Zhuqueibacterota bacterium]